MNVFRAGSFALELGKKTHVMGILNYTPDSFSDAGTYFSPEAALERALTMQDEGADIIDLGANSTRPGARILSEDEEAERLLPALTAMRGKLSVPLSVDTFYPACARLALQNGASMINDVSGTFNPGIAAAVKEHGAGLIVTHAPGSADNEASYPDGVVTAVRAYFIDVIKKAYDAGLELSQLCLDPGIGFGKSRGDDAGIIRNINWLKMNPCALLIGVSRKRITAVDSSAPAGRDYATAAANTAAIAGGVDIIRVHNTAAGVQSAKFADIIYRNGEH